MSTGEASRSLAVLASRAQLGDRVALELLLRRLQDPLREHVRSLMRDDDAAADVLQDTLWIVCRKLSTVQDTAWVRAWAYRVATREALRALRKSGRWATEPIEENTVAHSGGAEPDVDDELLAVLPERLASLPGAAQTVLRMHYLQSLTQQEVAEALGIPIGTVKSRLAYGLRLLRSSRSP